MAAGVDNLASLDDEAVLQELADAQVTQLLERRQAVAQMDSPAAKPAAPKPMSPQADGVDDEFYDEEDPLAQPVNPVVSAKIAELISQLQAEKAAENAKKTQLAKREAEALDAIAAEVIEARDVAPRLKKPKRVAQEPLEKSLADVFIQRARSASSSGANLAEEILAQQMAAESVMDETVEANPSTEAAKPQPSQAEARDNLARRDSVQAALALHIDPALPPQEATRIAQASSIADAANTEPAAATSAVADLQNTPHQASSETTPGQMRNFLVALAIAFSAALAFVMAWHLFFT